MVKKEPRTPSPKETFLLFFGTLGFITFILLISLAV